jgi:hypothetical protein
VLLDGVPLPTVRHEGNVYLPVPRMGAEYEIRVRNHGPRPIVAIVSVDGLSAIDGCRVAPGDSVVLRGWRRDDGCVAPFRFVPRDSYAGRVGQPEDFGVIRLIAIEEQGSFVRGTSTRTIAIHYDTAGSIPVIACEPVCR